MKRITQIAYVIITLSLLTYQQLQLSDGAHFYPTQGNNPPLVDICSHHGGLNESLGVGLSQYEEMGVQCEDGYGTKVVFE